MNRHTSHTISTLLCLVLVFGMIDIANAGITDDVSTAIADGIDLFILRVTNAFLSATVSTDYGTGDPENSSVALDAIFYVATYTPDPFALPFLKELQDSMKDVFFDIWWFGFLIVIITALSLLIFSIDSFASLYENTGFDTIHGFKKIGLIILGGIFVLTLENAFVWCTLVLCSDLSKSVMMGSLNAIAFTPGNIVLYGIMGLAYGLLFLCFEFRSMVIMFFFSMSFIFGILLFIPITSSFAWKAHLYFIQIVFYQLAVILWYTFCIVFVDIFPGNISGCYLIMVLVSVWLSYKCIFHLDFVRGAGTIGKIFLFKKL